MFYAQLRQFNAYSLVCVVFTCKFTNEVLATISFMASLQIGFFWAVLIEQRRLKELCLLLSKVKFALKDMALFA